MPHNMCALPHVLPQVLPQCHKWISWQISVTNQAIFGRAMSHQEAERAPQGEAKGRQAMAGETGILLGTLATSKVRRQASL